MERQEIDDELSAAGAQELLASTSAAHLAYAGREGTRIAAMRSFREEPPMPALRAVPVTLTAAERKALKKRARGAKTAYRDRQRAQIVLLAARGLPMAAIARRLGITEDTARKWRGRFAARGLDGLADAPRSGRPRRISVGAPLGAGLRLRPVKGIRPP